MLHKRTTPDEPREWLNRANSDLTIAKSHLEDVYLEDLCYHAQQCVEKSFKAVLLSKQGMFSYTHDLAALASHIQATGIEVPDCFHSAVRLTRYAVQTRYPGIEEPVSEEQWQFSIESAGAILKWAEELLMIE